MYYMSIKYIPMDPNVWSQSGRLVWAEMVCSVLEIGVVGSRAVVLNLGEVLNLGVMTFRTLSGDIKGTQTTYQFAESMFRT